MIYTNQVPMVTVPMTTSGYPSSVYMTQVCVCVCYDHLYVTNHLSIDSLLDTIIPL